jgi:hypothetical protein
LQVRFAQAVTVLAAQSLSSRQPTLSCKPLYSFHRYYAQSFVPQLLRFVSVPFVSAARSPPAARVRLACWSLRAAAELFYFASASLWHFLAVALCTRSTPCFPPFNLPKTQRSTSHICRKGLSDTQTISLHHPCSTRRRLAMLGQCPQTIPLRSIHCSHRPAVWLKAVSPVCNFS